jgi:hypothetical protein
LISKTRCSTDLGSNLVAGDFNLGQTATISVLSDEEELDLEETVLLEGKEVATAGGSSRNPSAGDLSAAEVDFTGEDTKG